jgi:hypothetical protein
MVLVMLSDESNAGRRLSDKARQDKLELARAVR